jgi:hypothetical protein
MNGERNGRCFVDEEGVDEKTGFGIEEDENGNSPLTGEGEEDEGHEKYFTCVQLEVYQI